MDAYREKVKSNIAEEIAKRMASKKRNILTDILNMLGRGLFDVAQRSAEDVPESFGRPRVRKPDEVLDNTVMTLYDEEYFEAVSEIGKWAEELTSGSDYMTISEVEDKKIKTVGWFLCCSQRDPSAAFADLPETDPLLTQTKVKIFQLELDGIRLTRYVFLWDEKLDTTRVALIHTDGSRVTGLMQRIFNIWTTLNQKEDLDLRLARFCFLFAHCMPLERGSDVALEIMADAVLRFHQMKLEGGTLGLTVRVFGSCDFERFSKGFTLIPL